MNVTELMMPLRVAVNCMSQWAAVIIRPMPIVSVSTVRMMVPQTSSTITCMRPKPMRVVMVFAGASNCELPSSVFQLSFVTIEF